MDNANPDTLGHYYGISVSKAELEDETYKRHFGGGKGNWDVRGAFQLFFLTRMGLSSNDSFLDLGCGPLRAGVHLIRFLDPGKYYGMDYNADFIEIAKRLIAADPNLKVKSPSVHLSQDFSLPTRADPFAFILAFSVLNHCSPKIRTLFFDNIPQHLAASGRIYISHASWFQSALLFDSPLILTRTINTAEAILPGLDLSLWGWPKGESIFPILELSRR